MDAIEIKKRNVLYVEDGQKKQVNDGEENRPKEVGVDLHQGVHESSVDHPGDDKFCKRGSHVMVMSELLTRKVQLAWGWNKKGPFRPALVYGVVENVQKSCRINLVFHPELLLSFD